MKVMMRLNTLVLSFLPLLSITQGIHFENGETWAQIKAKAKKEQKFIFVDCFTTWCGPCKAMDKEVYPNDTVGEYMNDKFLSVKVQMDKTDLDNDSVKKWYSTAHDFAQIYTITAYPSYLFFSPDGEPLHKAIGIKNPEEFVELAKEAQDPDKQYYSVLKNYKPGALDTAELIGLVRSLISTDKKLSATLMMDYLQRIKPDEILNKTNIDLIRQLNREEKIKDWTLNYIRQIEPSQLYDTLRQLLVRGFTTDTMVQLKVKSYLQSLSKKEIQGKDNFLLTASFSKLIHVGDRWFDLFYKKAESSDAAMANRGFSRRVVDDVLYNEMIFPKIKTANETDADINWNELYEVIKHKTNAECAKRNIINRKVDFYSAKTKDAEKRNSEEKWKWGKLYAAAFAVQKETYGFKTDDLVDRITNGNNLEFSIYRYCNDPRIINEALDWLDKVMRQDPGIDYSYVYAGLLYKLGKIEDAKEKIEEAKAWQWMTIKILEGRCYEAKKDILEDKSYLEQKDILDKMERKEKFENLIRWNADNAL